MESVVAMDTVMVVFWGPLGDKKMDLFNLSISAKMAARVLWRANPTTWTWCMASLQSCVILSVRAEGANNSNFYPASRAEELMNVGTWGESKCVLPDTEMSAAKKKKESQQQHSLLLFSCWPCQQNHSGGSSGRAVRSQRSRRWGVFGLSSCTLINRQWDFNTSHQLWAKDTDGSDVSCGAPATGSSHMPTT